MPSPDPIPFDPPQPYRPRPREGFDVERHHARLEVFVVATACLVWLLSTVTAAILLIRDPTGAALAVMLVDALITPVVVVVRRVIR